MIHQDFEKPEKHRDVAFAERPASVTGTLDAVTTHSCREAWLWKGKARRIMRWRITIALRTVPRPHRDTDRRGAIPGAKVQIELE